MDLFGFLEKVTKTPGLSGSELPVAEVIAESFTPVVDDVSIDCMQNVIARAGSAGPRVMVCAHLDEIGLIVRAIEDDGSIRVTNIGGVDTRILPALEVDVQTVNGPLYGVIGAKPPHVQTPADRGKSLGYDDLYVDIGYPAETVRQKVRVGDRVTMRGPAQKLSGEIAASKTLDDRACVAVMLNAAERMRRMTTKAQVFYVSTAQEEVGSYGALTSAHAIDPDIAIAIDVAHGEGPGTDKLEAFPFGKVVLTEGPVIHPALLKLVKKVADEHHIEYAVEISGSRTWTDADEVQVTRMGIPSILLSVPVRYMHTTVETIDMDTVRECGRLLSLFIDELSREWEGIKWY